MRSSTVSLWPNLGTNVIGVVIFFNFNYKHSKPYALIDNNLGSSKICMGLVARMLCRKHFNSYTYGYLLGSLVSKLHEMREKALEAETSISFKFT